MRSRLFGGLAIVVYTGLAYARSVSGGGCCGASMPGGLEFALLISVEVLVAALIVSLGALVWWLPTPEPKGPALEAIVGRTVQEQQCGPVVVDGSAASSCAGVNLPV
jgi:hypothetical protein